MAAYTAAKERSPGGHGVAREELSRASGGNGEGGSSKIFDGLGLPVIVTQDDWMRCVEKVYDTMGATGQDWVRTILRSMRKKSPHVHCALSYRAPLDLENELKKKQAEIDMLMNRGNNLGRINL